MTSEIFTNYGLAAVFLVFVLEGAMLLYFMPSEAIIPGALLVLGQDPATVASVITLAVAGSTIGQLGLFLATRKYGKEFVLENRFFRLEEKWIQKLEHRFEKYGHLAIVATNTFLLRGTMTIPAGLSQIKHTRFAIYSATGTLMYASLLTLAGNLVMPM